jgi:hypothetical protein
MSGLEPLLLAGLTAGGATAGAGAGISLGAIGTAAAIGGSALAAIGSIQQGNSARAAAEAEALQAERKASEEQSAAQRNAEQKRKQAQLVMSRQQAVAASSGGGATDVGVLDLMGDVAAQGELMAQEDIYRGRAKADGLEYSAAVRRMAGNNAQTAGVIGAGTSILNGVSTWSRYRQGYYGGGRGLYE